MDLHQNFVDGRFADAGGGEHTPVLNPARDTVISETPDSPAAAVGEAVAAAKRAQGAWKRFDDLDQAIAYATTQSTG